MNDTVKILENDAIVVLCLTDMKDSMSHHEFRVRATTRGFQLSKSATHNMLHRAMGRVFINRDGKWQLTTAGLAYRDEVLHIMTFILNWEAQPKSSVATFT